MARKKRIILILIILSTLLLAGPGVVDIANAEPISSSIPTDIERQSVPSTLSPSDSIDDGPAQESVKWNLGWNSFDGNWFYVDSVNPVSLHSGWLYTMGPGTGSIPRRTPWPSGSMSAMAPHTGSMAPARWRPDGCSTAGPGTTRRAPARWRAAPYPSAACPTASTPGRGHADGLPD